MGLHICKISYPLRWWRIFGTWGVIIVAVFVAILVYNATMVGYNYLLPLFVVIMIVGAALTAISVIVLRRIEGNLHPSSDLHPRSRVMYGAVFVTIGICLGSLSVPGLILYDKNNSLFIQDLGVSIVLLVMCTLFFAVGVSNMIAAAIEQRMLQKQLHMNG